MINWYKKQNITIRAAVIGGMFAIAAAIITVIFDSLKPAPIVVVQIPTEISTGREPTITPYTTFVAPSPMVIQPPYQSDLTPCYSFVVIPFLREIRLTIYKMSTSITMRITYYDGYKVAHSLENGIAYGNFDVAAYYTFGASESYVINNPYPGTWVVESNSSCDYIDPYYEVTIKFSDDMLTLETTDGMSNKSYYIIYSAWVNHEYKLRPPENPDFSFQVLAKVLKPDRTISSYEMEWMRENESFISKEPIDFSQPGDYKIDVVIYLPNCDIESGFKVGYIPAICKGIKEYHRYSETFSPP